MNGLSIRVTILYVYDKLHKLLYCMYEYMSYKLYEHLGSCGASATTLFIEQLYIYIYIYTCMYIYIYIYIYIYTHTHTFQWHFPLDFHFCDFWCLSRPRPKAVKHLERSRTRCFAANAPPLFSKWIPRFLQHPNQMTPLRPLLRELRVLHICMRVYTYMYVYIYIYIYNTYLLYTCIIHVCPEDHPEGKGKPEIRLYGVRGEILHTSNHKSETPLENAAENPLEHATENPQWFLSRLFRKPPLLGPPLSCANWGLDFWCAIFCPQAWASATRRTTTSSSAATTARRSN